MNEWMDTAGAWVNVEVLWGVALWRLGMALVIIFLGFLSRRLVRSAFEGFLRRRAERTRVQWDNDLITLVPQPLALVVQVLLWSLAAAVLVLPQEPVDVRRIVFQGLEVALAVALIWVAFRLTDVATLAMARASEKTETKLDDQAVPLLRKTVKVFLAVTIGVMVIQNLGYSVTSLIASLGIGGLALALAARDTVANFFGSIVIFTDSPFQIGDWVVFNEVEGTVEEVGFRTTRIRRFDKALVTVPNQTFTSTSIINYSNRDRRRIKLTVGVSYETTPAQMRALLEALRTLIREHPGIDQSFHLVNFTDLGGSSLDVLVYCFTNTVVWVEYLAIQEELLLRIMQIVEELGLEIAFPTRTVYLRDEHWPPGEVPA